MNTLEHIEIDGFKSIKHTNLRLGKINVLIGANGAGKSNFISLFKMLNFMTTESLQVFVLRSGGANSLLYYGSQKTPRMFAQLTFRTDTGIDTYYVRLSDAAPDTLIFVEEKILFQRDESTKPKEILLGSGHKETKLNEFAERGDKTVIVIRRILRDCQVFQFHDTSENSRIRKEAYINDNRFLYKDAGNLAAYLYMLKERHPESYKRIVSTIKLAAPHFQDFVLEPSKLNPNNIILNWKELGSEYLFGPHQLPDGLIRFISLVTLLLQPRENLPDVIIIDEPELGLHPSAINLLGALLREVSQCCQVIMATQSVNLVDQFEPEDIVILERKKVNNQNEFSTEAKRLDREELKSWLEEYTLSELWQKNLLGGRPGK